MFIVFIHGMSEVLKTCKSDSHPREDTRLGE